jgi:enoyl-CoA hydratase
MKLERSGDVAVLRMDAGKGNAMSRAYFDGLVGQLDDLGDARALVITGRDKFFSAGLALPELIDLDRDTMRAFMQRFEATMIRILTLPCPTVAAVNGHAIAGGCVLAMQCDYRIMAAGKAKIGLSEVTLGVGLPAGVIETLRHMMPGSSLFPVAQRGELFGAERALALGLVDEIASFEQIEGCAIAKATELAALGPAAYAQIKSALQRPMLAAIRETSVEGLERWLDTWYSAEARVILRATVDKLSG